MTLAMASALMSAHFRAFSAKGCRSISSCFLSSLLALGFLDELSGVSFAGPDPVDVIYLMDGLIHAIACVVEINKENLGTQNFSVFFPVQAMGCFATLFKTLVAL